MTLKKSDKKRTTVKKAKISLSKTSERAASRPPAHDDIGAENSRRTRSFPIVGIGASAGGLEAFEQFFRNMPGDSNMSFVLIPHLSPDHKSIMSELLSRHTTMSVVQAENGMKVKPNCVYIIPPDKDMSIL